VDIEKKEFLGTTKASSFATYGFLFGSIGCYFALTQHITALLISLLCIGSIVYALVINYQQGFNIRWRLANFIFHCFFLLALILGVGFVLFALYS
jgi:succinate dehydrogenase hydrophobic anchor subunit